MFQWQIKKQEKTALSVVCQRLLILIVTALLKHINFPLVNVYNKLGICLIWMTNRMKVQEIEQLNYKKKTLIVTLIQDMMLIAGHRYHVYRHHQTFSVIRNVSSIKHSTINFSTKELNSIMAEIEQQLLKIKSHCVIY